MRFRSIQDNSDRWFRCEGRVDWNLRVVLFRHYVCVQSIDDGWRRKLDVERIFTVSIHDSPFVRYCRSAQGIACSFPGNKDASMVVDVVEFRRFWIVLCATLHCVSIQSGMDGGRELAVHDYCWIACGPALL